MTIRFSLYPTIAWLLWHHIIPFNFIWRTQNQWQRKLSFLSFHLFWQIYWLVGSWDGNATPARLIWCLYSAKVFEYNTPQAFPTRPRRDIILRRNVIGNYVFNFFILLLPTWIVALKKTIINIIQIITVIVMHEWLVEFGKASHNWCLPQPKRARKSAHHNLTQNSWLFQLEIWQNVTPVGDMFNI